MIREILSWVFIVLILAYLEWLFFGLTQMESTAIQWGIILIPLGIIRLVFVLYSKRKAK